MENARSWSRRGTCSRAYVGCVISREGRPLAAGYNGAPAGMTHCNHDCCCEPRLNDDHRPECPSQKPCTLAVHSEANAIAFAAKYGVSTDEADLHTTRAPCMNCAMLIINSGIYRVVWDEPHRDMNGITLLTQAGLEVVQYAHYAETVDR